MTDREKIIVALGLVTLLIVGMVLRLTIGAKQRAERDRDVAVANAVVAQTEQLRIEQDGRAAVLRLQYQHDADSIAAIALAELSTALQAMNDSMGVRVTALTRLQVSYEAKMKVLEAVLDMTNALTPQGDTVRIAPFVLVGPPVEGEIVVEVPKDPSASIMLTAVLKPSPWAATLQLGCTEDHVASFALDTPDWVPMNIGLGVVDQDVCLPLPDFSFAADLFSFSASKVVWAGAGGLVALLLSGVLGR